MIRSYTRQSSRSTLTSKDENPQQVEDSQTCLGYFRGRATHHWTMKHLPGSRRPGCLSATLLVGRQSWRVWWNRLKRMEAGHIKTRGSSSNVPSSSFLVFVAIPSLLHSITWGSIRVALPYSVWAKALFRNNVVLFLNDPIVILAVLPSLWVIKYAYVNYLIGQEFDKERLPCFQVTERGSPHRFPGNHPVFSRFDVDKYKLSRVAVE